jgi:arginase family enzyme
MQLRLLHLDDAFDGQRRFVARCNELGARRADMRRSATAVRLWGREHALQTLQAELAREFADVPPGSCAVTWLGSGDFHHVTQLLLPLVAARSETPVTVVHFDNHPDWVRCASGSHCGSWVSRVMRSGIVDRVVSLGVSSTDLDWPELKRADLSLLVSGDLVVFPVNHRSSRVLGDYGRAAAHTTEHRRIHWTQFSDRPSAATTRAVMGCIETDAVYITIDKDVLQSRSARTNWDQGELSLDGLIAWLGVIIGQRHVVGVDICGDYSRPTFGGSAIDVLRKRGEAFLDQPVARTRRDEDMRINEESNLKLLSTLVPLLC